MLVTTTKLHGYNLQNHILKHWNTESMVILSPETEQVDKSRFHLPYVTLALMLSLCEYWWQNTEVEWKVDAAMKTFKDRLLSNYPFFGSTSWRKEVVKLVWNHCCRSRDTILVTAKHLSYVKWDTHPEDNNVNLPYMKTTDLILPKIFKRQYTFTQRQVADLIQLIVASVEFQIFYYTSTTDKVIVETYIHMQWFIGARTPWYVTFNS